MLRRVLVPSTAAWKVLNRLFRDGEIARAWLLSRFRPACAELQLPMPWSKPTRDALEQEFCTLLRPLRPSGSVGPGLGQEGAQELPASTTSVLGHWSPNQGWPPPEEVEEAPLPPWGVNVDEFLDLCIDSWIQEEEQVIQRVQAAIDSQQQYLVSKAVHFAEVESGEQQYNEGSLADPIAQSLSPRKLSEEERDSLLRIWEVQHRCDPEQIDFEQYLWSTNSLLHPSLEAYAPRELMVLLQRALQTRVKMEDWQAWSWEPEWDWGGILIQLGEMAEVKSPRTVGE